MSVKANVRNDEETIEIEVSGRFDFNVHREFREAYENVDQKIEHPKYIINLGGTDYMDSSALGMLLLLREYAGGNGANIAITKCREEIKEILNISNFHLLFNVESVTH